MVRRSLVAARDLKAGERVGPDDVEIKRPADGLAPSELDRVLGSELVKSIAAEHPFTEEHLG